MRLIDADELSKVKFHPLPYTHIVPADLLKAQTEAYERGWNDAIDAVIGLPSKQQWIPIEDRPPEFGKDVLISHRGFVSIDWLTQSEGNAYFFASRVAIADIDVWMPLPEPWNEAR